nr:hypothetical protein [Tanacetum cinerariifolium]
MDFQGTFIHSFIHTFLVALVEYTRCCMSCLRHHLRLPTHPSTLILSMGGYFEELTRSCQMEHPPLHVYVSYVSELEYPEYLVPSDVEAPLEDQPLPDDASPTALSPGYVADSNLDEDLKEDSEEDHVDYPANGGDDDDDDTGDEDEEPFEYEEDDEEEEHIAPADSPDVPVIDLVPSAEDTEAFETDESTPTPILSPPLPPLPSSLHLPPPIPTSLPLPLSLLPPLLASLSIPSPVNRREDTFEAELPPRKRLCLTALTSRYEVEESSMAAPIPTGGHRADYGYEVEESSMAAPIPTGGHRADYGFIGKMNAEIKRQRANEDTQDLYAVIEDTQDRQTHIYQRVDILAEDRQFHYETAQLLDQEALVS